MNDLFFKGYKVFACCSPVFCVLDGDFLKMLKWPTKHVNLTTPSTFLNAPYQVFRVQKSKIRICLTYNLFRTKQRTILNMSKLTSPQKTHITQSRERVEEDGRRVVAESQHIDQVDLQDS